MIYDDLMREKKDVLAKWLTLEVGKTLTEGVGEVGGAADIFEWNAEETKRIYGQTVHSRFPETRVHVYYQPVGVVAALIPFIGLDLGGSAAQSVILMFVVILLTVLQFRYVERRVQY